MIKASEALKKAKATASTQPKPRKWNIFDTLQLRKIEKRIKKASNQGKTSIKINSFELRSRVADELEKNGYKYFRTIEIDGENWLSIYWDESC